MHRRFWNRMNRDIGGPYSLNQKQKQKSKTFAQMRANIIY